MKQAILTLMTTIFLASFGLLAETPDFGTVLRRAETVFAALKDYTCYSAKKELIGKNRYKEQWNIDFKFRKPFNIYAKIGDGEGRGTEIVFAQGRYKDRLVVHKTGALGLVDIYLDPKSPLACEGERHPIFESYTGYTIEVLGKNFRLMKEKGRGEVKFTSEGAVDGRKTWKFKAVFPPDLGFYAATILMDFDQETGLPVKIQSYGWDGQLWEDYTFTKVRLNTGLTEKDFDIANPNYGFRKK